MLPTCIYQGIILVKNKRRWWIGGSAKHLHEQWWKQGRSRLLW